MQSITFNKKQRLYAAFGIAFFILLTPAFHRVQVESEEELRSLHFGIPIPFVPYARSTQNHGLDETDYTRLVRHLPQDYEYRYGSFLFAPLFFFKYPSVMALMDFVLVPLYFLWTLEIANIWLYFFNIIICYSVFELSIRAWNRYARQRGGV